MKPHSRTAPTATSASSSTPCASALDRLYEAPLDGFVSLRKAFAAELRAAGDLVASREVLGAKKPSRTAWAVNQLVRRSPGVLRAAFEAFDAAVHAQSSADADAIRETTRAFRERVSDVVAHCERLLAEAGTALNSTQRRRLTETIRAAVAGGAQSRGHSLSGRLTEDLAAEDSLASLEAWAGRGDGPREGEPVGDRNGDRERERDLERQRERELEAQKARAIERARHQVAALEEEARGAREAARAADVVASRAQAEAERARSHLAALEDRLARARDALREL